MNSNSVNCANHGGVAAVVVVSMLLLSCSTSSPTTAWAFQANTLSSASTMMSRMSTKRAAGALHPGVGGGGGSSGSSILGPTSLLTRPAGEEELNERGRESLRTGSLLLGRSRRWTRASGASSRSSASGSQLHHAPAGGGADEAAALAVDSVAAVPGSEEEGDEVVQFQQQSSARLLNKEDWIPRYRALLIRIGMMAYIVGMCLALPLTLLPQRLLYRLGMIDRIRKERWALSTAQFCARWMLRLIPFCNARYQGYHDPDPQPAIWVCNHTSMLDVFILLALDLQVRGKKKRPIKIVYWKQLEDNPITKLLFHQAGFIPVQMQDNGNGNDNQYDRSSFRQLLKSCKQAFSEGFDIGVLPEGQLNPFPERGLMPVHSGAYTLAKMSRRPMSMMALAGIHQLWHPDANIGMKVTTGNDVHVRVYPHSRKYESADEFVDTFTTVVGHYTKTQGQDLPKEELESWLSGSTWRQMQLEKKQEEEAEKASIELEKQRQLEEAEKERQKIEFRRKQDELARRQAALIVEQDLQKQQQHHQEHQQDMKAAVEETGEVVEAAAGVAAAGVLNGQRPQVGVDCTVSTTHEEEDAVDGIVIEPKQVTAAEVPRDEAYKQASAPSLVPKVDEANGVVLEGEGGLGTKNAAGMSGMKDLVANKKSFIDTGSTKLGSVMLTKKNNKAKEGDGDSGKHAAEDVGNDPAQI